MISIINHSYWSHVHQQKMRFRGPGCQGAKFALAHSSHQEFHPDGAGVVPGRAMDQASVVEGIIIRNMVDDYYGWHRNMMKHEPQICLKYGWYPKMNETTDRQQIYPSFSGISYLIAVVWQKRCRDPLFLQPPKLRFSLSFPRFYNHRTFPWIQFNCQILDFHEIPCGIKI